MVESGKRERLRGGESVELKSGVWGRLNKDNRTMELDSGKVLPISETDQRDLFPADEGALDVARRTEKLEGQVKKAPFGEFLHQFGSQGLANAPKDWLDYFTQTGDQYLRQKEAEGRVSGRISEESPFTSAAATVASFVPDIALTHGMSAVKAAPLVTGLSAGSRILSEPEEVAKETVLSAGAGKILDMGTNALNKIAQRRGQVRALPGQQAAVQQQNQLGQQAVDASNLQQSQQFNALKQNVKSVNEARLQQHQTDLLNRQNQMIQDQNAYQAAKLARDQNIVQLKNAYENAKLQRNTNQAALESQYKAARDAAETQNKIFADQFKAQQAQYQQALKELPELQKKAQAEYSANVVKNAESISKAFPKDSKIYSNQFGVDEFIADSIQKSGLAGSREAGQASRILKSIMPEGEILTADSLASRYRALEGAIQKSSPEVAAILNEFKSSMGGKLNSILADNMAYSRVMPSLKTQITKDVHSALDSMGFKPSPMYSLSALKRKADGNLNQLFREMTPQDFMKKFQSGEIREQLLKKIMSPGDFEVDLSYLTPNKKFGRISSGSDRQALLSQGIVDVPTKDFQAFSNIFNSKLDKALAKAELRMIATDVDAATKLGGKVKGTYGVADSVPNPNPPIPESPVPLPIQPAELPQVPPIQLPGHVMPPNTPNLPAKPSLMSSPNQPAPQVFSPAPEPSLAPAQGMAEGMGDLLEKNLMGGNTLMNNPVAKLAGLKYLLGKGAVPLEAAYLGMKGLTSPTAGGEMARMAFKQSGVQAIKSWAEKYPSYQNGILQDPIDRRSLTKEVEEDPEIPIEQKAILQSKINRGLPLEARLQ